ncbi:aspartate dehydrogenase [Nioella nitratireducens]|uniref:aspartate dehydrogenase n=1 Tax=Nioella nitratireducens TaxID=1287720 RepID=UPI0008FD8BA1|nr:aspartate dehydrogenase [Nioella nitratireducens]
MRLGLIGFGNIATTLIGLLQNGGLVPEGLVVQVRPGCGDKVRAELETRCPDLAAEVVSDTDDLLAARPDLVVECAGHSAVTSYVPLVLQAGIDVLVVSVGALADAALQTELTKAAQQGGARLILPAGAVAGVDMLAALGAADAVSVRYRGTKPPQAWAGTPAEDALDLAALTEPATFFTGTAREAARCYPKNANVAATLALAGPGFEATEVALVADPAATGNIHEYDVEAPAARYSIRIEGKPSTGNIKTSVTTVYSVFREIRNRVGPVAI